MIRESLRRRAASRTPPPNIMLPETRSNAVVPSLQVRIDQACNKALFTDVFGKRFDANAVRQMYETNRQWPLNSPDAIQIPQFELQCLISELDRTLGKYKSPSSGLIGNMLYFLKGSSSSPRLPTVENYAKILVLAAARIGSDRVAALYSAWLQGEPTLLRQCALLTGLKTDGKLHPVHGMHMDTLPTNGNDFPRSLRINEYDIHEQRFSHRAMLCIDYRTDPALYDPATHEEIPSLGPRRQDLVNPALAAVSLENFCRSMSLIADNQVDWFIAWDDYGDIEAFFLGSSFGSSRNRANNSSPVVVSEADVRASLDLHAHLAALPRLDVSVTRWRRSKGSANVYEQLVELRIALESVLLSDDRGTVGEKRHRLAIRGAWLLGSTFAERRHSFRTLQALYDYASSVIHAGNPKEKASAPLDKVISDAQHLCRAAILRIANVRAFPDWTDIVLDRGKSGPS